MPPSALRPAAAPDPSRRRAAVALGLLPLAACTSGAPFRTPTPAPTEQPAAPRVRAGDRWRYAQVNLYNGIRQTEIDCEAIETTPRLRVRLTDADGRARPDEVYADAWRVIEEPFYDYLQVFEQPVPLLPEVMAVGETSRLDTAFRAPQASGDERYAWQQRLRAQTWERVRVPAGEFDALRVVRYIWFGHPDRMRLYPVRREHLWYAPAVNRWVRREWTGEYRWPGMRRGAPLREDWIAWELMAYRPAPAG